MTNVARNTSSEVELCFYHCRDDEVGQLIGEICRT
jgi:hypothetical protein